MKQSGKKQSKKLLPPPGAGGGGGGATGRGAAGGAAGAAGAGAGGAGGAGFDMNKPMGFGIGRTDTEQCKKDMAATPDRTTHARQRYDL
jgi:hypothetical protein